MLLGHIDLVDRHAVRGWAADTDRPYGTLEVAVFVDGQLSGLTRADQARDDLKDPTTLGSGAHGITYRFDPPLSALDDHDVVVRFAAGGRLLGQWRVAREIEGPASRAGAPRPADAIPATPATPATPAAAAPAAPAAATPAAAAPTNGKPTAPGAAASANGTPAAAAAAIPAAAAPPNGIPAAPAAAAQTTGTPSAPGAVLFGSGALPAEVLVGCVDICTREKLAGWAASETNPDAVQDISIFVDDRKVAQLVCNMPRADLARAGVFGDGARAFIYHFDPPLPDDRDARITVAHARTGVPLDEGNVCLVGGETRAVPSPAPLAENEPRLLPPPSDPRDLFDWLGLYDEPGGLAQLLSRLAFTGERPEQIHYAAFGAHPASVEDVLRWGAYYPRDHLHELLLSDAFQTRLIPTLLRAFPEKRRLIFVHIPKCAGTDLTFHFRARHASLDRSLTDPSWTPKPAMLRRIARVMAHLRNSDSIFVHGHINLADHIADAVIRPTDRVFTVIRDPFAVAASQINYVLTRFDEDIAAGISQPDTAEWSRVMDLGALPKRMSDAFVKRVTSAALRNEDLILPNSLCLWLGGEGTQPVVDRLASYDVEITNVDRYNEWLRAAWGIDAMTRWNASKQFVSLKNLSSEDISYLVGITREDQRLYRTVERILTASGKPSLRGDDLRGVVVP